MSKPINDITDPTLLRVRCSMRQYLISERSVDPKSFPKETITADMAHTIPRWAIAGAVSLMAMCLGLRGGSSGDVDLYGLITGYILDRGLRGRINEVLQEWKDGVHGTAGRMLLG